MLNQVEIGPEVFKSNCIRKRTLFTSSSVTLALHFGLIVDIIIPCNKGHEAVQDKRVLALHSICILFVFYSTLILRCGRIIDDGVHETVKFARFHIKLHDCKMIKKKTKTKQYKTKEANKSSCSTVPYKSAVKIIRVD